MAVGWSIAAKSDAVNAVGANSTATWIAAYTDVDATVEVTGGAYTRKQATYPLTTTGSTTTPVVTLDIPANTTVRALARHTTASGGSPYDARTLTVAEPFGSGGKLDVTNNLYVV